MSVVINGTTGISGIDGTASAPAVQGNDTNTGIFFPANDTIAFAEGGTEVMRIDPNGRVGIGNTSPINKLSVQTAGADGIILEKDTGSPSNSGRMFFNADGTSFAICATANTLSFFSGSIPGNSTGTTRLAIDSSGRVTMPFQPAFRVEYNTGVAFPTNAAIVWNSIVFNDGNHYSNSTGRFTAPVTGRYQFSVSLLAGTAGNFGLFGFRVNGSLVAPATGGAYFQMYVNVTNGQTLTAAPLIKMNAGDYLDVFIPSPYNTYHTTGYNNFSGYLVG